MRILAEEQGQASLEYALVLAATLALAAALAALWRSTSEGSLLDLALAAASHLASGGIDDIALF